MLARVASNVEGFVRNPIVPFPATSASPLALLTSDLIELARERGRVVPLEALQVRGWPPSLIKQLALEACSLAAGCLGFEPAIGEGRGVPKVIVRLPNRWALFRLKAGYQWQRT
jgi:hypothetical protein